MLIRIGYGIALRLPFATTVLYVLHIHPSRTVDLVGSEDSRVRDPDALDNYASDAPQHDVRELPLETLACVSPSRYCEVDSELLDFAWQTFGATPAGLSNLNRGRE
jgi:hypothetical protein